MLISTSQIQSWMQKMLQISILVATLISSKTSCMSLLQNDIEASQSLGGCVDVQQAWPVTKHVVACSGAWEGHVENASLLCGTGFQVCSHRDKELLRQVHWSVATSIEGCYAANAAHDGDKCRPCKDLIESDDMAGLGKDCPHQNFGQQSCFLEGRIDSSCCLDALQHKACHFQPMVTTGVLCCRIEDEMVNLPVQAPFSESILAPAVQMVKSIGERAEIQCPLAKTAEHNVHMIWTKDGHLLPHITSARWTVDFSKPENTGLYACHRNRANVVGIGHVNLTVTTVKSYGCADGTSEGFHDAHDVQGCSGVWSGHVKRATKELCAAGWRVCTPKDKPFLEQIDDVYLKDFGGCFAYNAAQVKHKCKRCKPGLQMAALGGDCPIVHERLMKSHFNRMQPQQDESCYSQRTYLAYPTKYLANQNNNLKAAKLRNPAKQFGQQLQHAQASCAFKPNLGLSGVLCCRKPPISKAINRNIVRGEDIYIHRQSGITEDQGCYPLCRHGGTCLPGARCLCPPGYFGHACQHGGCSARCLNGGRCFYGYCKCYTPFYGSHCQFSRAIIVHLP